MTDIYGFQLLLDLHTQKDRLLVRRCLRNHPLADALHLTDFPSLAIFKRGEKKPILVAESVLWTFNSIQAIKDDLHISRLRRLLLTELENFLKDESDPSRQVVQFHSRKNKTNPCDADPEK